MMEEHPVSSTSTDTILESLRGPETLKTFLAHTLLQDNLNGDWITPYKLFAPNPGYEDQPAPFPSNNS